ncbi:MAG TPA: putative baseplate assembly protein [Actinomycetota bacterium]|nr:putative baseplate assembly protein [Actinomycetota bacterium]
MTLPAPVLDDRRFQDLVDEAKRMVQERCPEWTDHNVSDPGVTLIETFAFMVDQLLYRVNRVPDRVYVKLLDLIGVRRLPPTAAEAEVTFWLSAPQTETVVVPRGTEVATERTETDDPVTFSVVEPLAIPPCDLVAVAARPAEGPPQDLTARLLGGEGSRCFSDPPLPGDELLIGLSNAVPSATVLLRVDCTIKGVGVDPRKPPLVWEASTGTSWTPCEVERDETGGLNRAGDVILHVPDGHTSTTVAGSAAAWLRCRVLPATPDRLPYHDAPRVNRVVAGTVGGTAAAVNADLVENEILGTSEGTPGQRFRVQHAPVVPSADPHVLEVSAGDGWEEWSPVETFAFSGRDDRHFDLDETAGEVVLGPAVREPDGSLRHYGAVPPAGAVLRLRSYRSGGGASGNVAAGAISILKGAIPYVTRVENRRAATGGVAVEDLESTKQRGPLVLRTRDRAVTASDYEALTRSVAPEIARVKCLPPDPFDPPGLVRILVVPAVPGSPDVAPDIDALLPSSETLERIARHLDERRPVGTHVFVQPPTYQGVTVVARLQARRGQVGERVAGAARSALYRYFHPVAGGPDGTGWPFGRPIHLGEVHGVLQQVHGIDLVEDVRLFPADPVSGWRGDPLHRLDLDQVTLAFSYDHQVLVEEA